MDETWFKARYEADKVNAAKQSWKEHADWVKRFYEGQRFPPISGWSDRERDLVKRAPQHQGAIESLGRMIASEWSKDNSVRKVSTSDLQTWGKRFGDAAKDPAALLAALDEVRADLTRRGVAGAP